MTNLTNQTQAATYPDLITTTNNGMGFTNVLANVQDGLGNNSPMQIATNAINFNRGLGSFQLDGTAITATAANINSVTQTNPVFPGTYVVIPSHTTAGRPGAPVAGTMGFNTTTSMMEYWNGATWISF
jgi:hypothetical protein